MNENLLFEQMVQWRRHLHQYPETGYDVDKTAALAANMLETSGITVRTGVGQSGVVGDLIIPGASACIALRADMDALPMDEEGSPQYKSKVPGKAHMCGHDAHTAILMGTAQLLSAKRNSLTVNVRFIFQPAEEGGAGALKMIEDGCLDGVDSIFGLHVWPWLDTGEIGICPGPAMAQSDRFEVYIEGKGGHAASPHLNIDPILVGSQITLMVQTLQSKIISPLDPVVVNVTEFHGGTAFNVTPSHTILRGTVRTYNPSVQQKIKEGLAAIVNSAALGFGAKAELRYSEGYPPLLNDENSSHYLKLTAQEIMPSDKVIYPGEKTMFGEDFAYYLQKIPGCFMQLGCRDKSKNIIHPLHHPKFDLDEECMKWGVRIYEKIIQNAACHK